MKKYPQEIFYIGNTKLLEKRKISIVGSRNTSSYTQQYTHILAKELSNIGITIVSGGAMGVDSIAHESAGVNNTIMVAGTGLDKRYPAINHNLIKEIEKQGLVLSQFKAGTPSTRYNFPIRNELVVALGEILIVTQADLNSGTLRSVEYALKMNKEIYTLPHQLGQSLGTLKFQSQNKIKTIYDIDKFLAKFSKTTIKDGKKDKFLEYCLTNPLYDDAMSLYPAEVFEYELSGKIEVKNGIIKVV
jgi:DNA processing protein